MAGFECEFVEKPPKAVQFECPICLLVLREPYQATCCGKSFCKECIEPVKEGDQVCPTCKTKDFISYPNKGLQQSLHEFLVYCTHKSRGCEWTGELRELDNHLNSDPPADKSLEGCPFAEISCPLGYAGCEVKIPRNEMKSHVNGDLLGHFLKQATQVSTLKKQLISCKQDLVQVTEQLASCRQNLAQSVRDNQDLKQRVYRLEGKNSELEGQLVNFREKQEVLPDFQVVDIVLPNYRQFKEDSGRWHSEPFYSHPRGYMMCLEVTFYTLDYLSVYVCFMQGEFDDSLKWPFRGEVTIHLVNQNQEGRYFTKTVIYSDDTDDSGYIGERVVDSRCRGDRHGFRRFFLIAHLEQNYVKNDCVKFQIQNITRK